MSSSLIGKLGTILAYIAAGLTDFHAVATSPDVSVALTAVVGFLTAHHIISSAFGRSVESDVTSAVHRAGQVAEAAAKAAQQAAADSGYRPPAA